MRRKQSEFKRFPSVAVILLLTISSSVSRAALVAHWPLNEGSGDVFQDVIGGSNGFLPIAEFDEQTEIEWDEGPPTQEHAVRFLGVNSFIATEFPGIEGDNPRTVSFWVKTFDQEAYFVGWGANRTGEKWHIRTQPGAGNGMMRTEFQGGQNFATTDITDDEWHFVASVFPEGGEGADILHYVDGQLDLRTGGNSIPINTAIGDGSAEWTDANSAGDYYVHFGGVLAHGFGRQLDGLMADVRIHDEALDENALREIMEGGGGVPGDFDGDGMLGIEDVEQLSQEVRNVTHTARFDLNGDQLVNDEDRTVWVKELKKTWFGDANLDGEFTSGDFVNVFQAGKFEQQVPADWSEGDWSGDGRFNSSDFVIAFQDGGFEAGPLVAASPVPEPLTARLVMICLPLIMLWRPQRTI